MKSQPEKFVSGPTRRDFIKTAAQTAAVVAGADLLAPTIYAQGRARKVAIVSDPKDSLAAEQPVRWAVEQLQDRLKNKDISVDLYSALDEIPRGAITVVVAGRDSNWARAMLAAAGLNVPDVPEATGLVRWRLGKRSGLLATGSDVRGLVYAVLELADRVRYCDQPAAQLQRPDRIVEKPANRIRSIGRLFTSEVEDKVWFYDKEFWREYLSNLIEQRINRFAMTLGVGYNSPRRITDSYFYFAYPFLLDVPGYNVKAVGLPDAERDRNLEMLKYIATETKRRGLHFQLALWTHAYEFKDSPDVNYTISGLRLDNHVEYCRAALIKLIETIPEIDGVTFRSHSESGIPGGSWEFWRVIYDGVKRASDKDGKKRDIDIHSKGIDHDLLKIALDTGMPVTVGPKYWAEHQGLPYHQAAIQAREWLASKNAKPGDSLENHRRFTRYGYADYLNEDRKFGVMYRIWPGTQRLLLWGDPAMAAGYSRYSQICGSDGVEWWGPLSFKGRMGSGVPGTRDAYTDASLHHKGGSWKKYIYTYRIWGRMLYNPNTPREVWSRYLEAEFGSAARDCEIALGRASRVLLLITTAHTPSCSNNGYWPEIHTNIPMAGDNRFGRVSPLDPALFANPDQFADELVSGKRSGKYSPFEVAGWLEDIAETANTHLARARRKIADPQAPAFRRLAIDTDILSGTAAYFAGKLRASVAYGFHLKTGDRAALKVAIARYGAARDAWAKLSKTSKVYVDDVTFGPNSVLRGHWADQLEPIEKDLAALEPKAREKLADKAPDGTAPAWADAISRPGFLPLPQQSRPSCRHMPPASVRPGKPLTVQITAESGYGFSKVRLHYRHVNQSDAYEIVEMTQRGGRFQTKIPGEYTQSNYPLLYFFEIHDAAGRVWMYPSLNADLANQPYIIARHA